METNEFPDVNNNGEASRQQTCPHYYCSYFGGQHFSEGQVWDDIQCVCLDCGANLDLLPIENEDPFDEEVTF